MYIFSKYSNIVQLRNYVDDEVVDKVRQQRRSQDFEDALYHFTLWGSPRRFSEWGNHPENPARPEPKSASFTNCVLQCLFKTIELVDHLIADVNGESINDRTFAQLFSDLIGQFWSGRETNIEPTRYHQLVAKTREVCERNGPRVRNVFKACALFFTFQKD